MVGWVGGIEIDANPAQPMELKLDWAWLSLAIKLNPNLGLELDKSKRRIFILFCWNMYYLWIVLKTNFIAKFKIQFNMKLTFYWIHKVHNHEIDFHALGNLFWNYHFQWWLINKKGKKPGWAEVNTLGDL